jgi:hypothetical protein
MWLTDPRLMCRKHLLGEHVEIHMFIGTIKAGKNLKGYIDKGLVSVDKIITRHDELVAEMIRRGYKHNSFITIAEHEMLWNYLCKHKDEVYLIDSLNNEIELVNRCEECRKKSLSTETKYFEYNCTVTDIYYSTNFCNKCITWIDKNTGKEFATINFTRSLYLSQYSEQYADYCLSWIFIHPDYRNINFTTEMITTFLKIINLMDWTVMKKFVYATGYTRQGERAVKPILEKLIIEYPRLEMNKNKK